MSNHDYNTSIIRRVQQTSLLFISAPIGNNKKNKIVVFRKSKKEIIV